MFVGGWLIEYLAILRTQGYPLFVFQLSYCQDNNENMSLGCHWDNCEICVILSQTLCIISLPSFLESSWLLFVDFNRATVFRAIPFVFVKKTRSHVTVWYNRPLCSCSAEYMEVINEHFHFPSLLPLWCSQVWKKVLGSISPEVCLLGGNYDPDDPHRGE